MNIKDDLFEVINKVISLPCLINSDFHRISAKNLSKRFIRRISTSSFHTPGYNLRIEFESDKFFKPTEDFSIENLEQDLIEIAGECMEWKCESLFKSMLQQFYDIMIKNDDGYPKYDLKVFENKSKYRSPPMNTQTGELTPTSVKSSESNNKSWAAIVQSNKGVPIEQKIDELNIVKLYRSIPFSLNEKIRMISLLSALNFHNEVKYWKGDRLNNEFEELSIVVYRRMTIENLDDLCEMYVIMNNMKPSEIPNNISVLSNLELIKEKLKVNIPESRSQDNNDKV
jgi:hypothetical protein